MTRLLLAIALLGACSSGPPKRQVTVEPEAAKGGSDPPKKPHHHSHEHPHGPHPHPSSDHHHHPHPHPHLDGQNGHHHPY